MSADELNAKPTLETILEKLSEFRQSFESFRQSVEARFDKLESNVAKLEGDIANLQTEMQTGFRKLDRKIELHAKNFADLYADERELESRVDKLEEKAS